MEWRKLSVDVTPGASGHLECQAVILTLGANARLRCQVEPLVGGEVLVPFWMYEPQGGGSPFPKPLVALGGSRVLEVGEAPADVDVQVDFSGEPGLVGEILPVRVLVSSKGDKVSSGKLSLEFVSLAPKTTAAVSDAPLLDLGSDVPVVEVLPAELLVRKGSEGGVSAEDEASEILSEAAQQSAEGGEGKVSGVRSEEYEKFSGEMSIPEIGAGKEWAAVVFLRWAQAADAGLTLSVSYEAEKEGAQHRKAKVVPMRGEEPLAVSHRWFAPFRKDALLPAPATASAKLPINDEAFFSVSVRSSSSVPVRVSGLVLILDAAAAEEVGRGTGRQNGVVDLLEASGREADSKADGVRDLRAGEAVSRLFRVRPLQTGEAITLGALSMTWQRLWEVPPGSWEPQLAPVGSELPLAPVSVERPHVVVETDLPACATLGKSFSMSVKVTNVTELLQEVGYSVSDSPSFVLGGSHSGQIIVLPRSVKTLTYELVPIQAGLLALPQMKFTAIRHGAKLNPTPGSAEIFVYPASSGHDGPGSGVLVEVR